MKSIPATQLRTANALGLIVAISILFAPLSSAAQEKERRIYQADSLGNIRYNKPSWTVQSDGRVIETNQYGEKMHHRQQYKIIGDQIVATDVVGNPQWHKPRFNQK